MVVARQTTRDRDTPTDAGSRHSAPLPPSHLHRPDKVVPLRPGNEKSDKMRHEVPLRPARPNGGLPWEWFRRFDLPRQRRSRPVL
jgi:hypothetical protein